MDLVTFALTMMILGMGGTLLALGLIVFIIELLKQTFPVDAKQHSDHSI